MSTNFAYSTTTWYCTNCLKQNQPMTVRCEFCGAAARGWTEANDGAFTAMRRPEPADLPRECPCCGSTRCHQWLSILAKLQPLGRHKN